MVHNARYELQITEAMSSCVRVTLEYPDIRAGNGVKWHTSRLSKCLIMKERVQSMVQSPNIQTAWSVVDQISFNGQVI